VSDELLDSNLDGDWAVFDNYWGETQRRQQRPSGSQKLPQIHRLYPQRRRDQLGQLSLLRDQSGRPIRLHRLRIRAGITGSRRHVQGRGNHTSEYMPTRALRCYATLSSGRYYFLKFALVSRLYFLRIVLNKRFMNIPHAGLFEVRAH
jgi:hypothetical protein